MSDPKNTNSKIEANPVQNDVRPEEESQQAGKDGAEPIRDAIRKFFSGMSREGRPTLQRDPKQDRTRPLVLLIGGIVGSVLLFIGVFSTPPERTNPMQRDRVEPNLGGREVAGPDRTPSVTPLLNAQVQPDELERSRLSAEDIQNTSQREIVGDLSAPDAIDATPEPEALPLAAGSRNRASRVPRPVVIPPAETDASASPAEPASEFSFGAVRPIPAPTPSSSSSASKSSIVYVRTPTVGSGEGNPLRETQAVHSSLLLPGSRLIARLESAVSSALPAPVVASVEYNYERNGVIVVPAGTKIIGELRQASANGLVSIAFQSLQMPGGKTEGIQAVAMDLKSEPLKGNVTGTNKGRNILTRTLSGVGTIAAYAVGGAGGLGQTITGSTLLRDRVAGNIASVGEQELTNAAIARNIVVTVPAQTRIYVVFQKSALEVQTSAPSPSIPGGPDRTMPMPTIQEMRELMDLRREINRMYQDSGATSSTDNP